MCSICPLNLETEHLKMGKQILIVDDDQEIRELLQEYLARAGFDVLVAAEGGEMYRHLANTSPDLIILDIMMPGDDGFHLCQKIRRNSQVPIIMLTAASDEADRVIGLELGADDYIAKPFSPRELMARIKALLRRAEFRQPEKESGRRLRFADWVLDTLSQHLINDDSVEQVDDLKQFGKEEFQNHCGLQNRILI